MYTFTLGTAMSNRIFKNNMFYKFICFFKPYGYFFFQRKLLNM